MSYLAITKRIYIMYTTYLFSVESILLLHMPNDAEFYLTKQLIVFLVGNSLNVKTDAFPILHQQQYYFYL